MTGPVGGSNSQACAACKHQRRKCAPDCVLAPYFPPHRHNEFLNVHKLFGVRNIINTLKKVDPNLREDAVRSMIHEAYFRKLDPVGGSHKILKNLYQTYNQTKAELNTVLEQLHICRTLSEKGEDVRGNPNYYYDSTYNRVREVPTPSNVVVGSNRLSSSSCVVRRDGSYWKTRDKDKASSSGVLKKNDHPNDSTTEEDVKPKVMHEVS